ncbi:TolC family protein [soil metagenome]
MKYYLRVCSLLLLMNAVSWHTVYAQTKVVLTPDAFIQQVKQFHPVARQANLITENAVAGLLSARGSFDPVFELNNNSKSLDSVNYYRYNNTELKIPTAFAVEIKAGFEKSNGQFINPELTNGVASYIGVEIPLLNGLLMDKRRAALQQAKIFKLQSEQERLVLINDLLFDAYTTYWQWAGAYGLFKTYNNYVEVAEKRLRLVNVTFLHGDRSVADTVEAYTQLQNYQLLQAEALMELNNKALELSAYLWAGDGNPYLLPQNYIPDTNQFEMLLPLRNIEDLVKQLPGTHPRIKTYQYKLKDLEVERKLKFQNLLPVFNVRANMLSKDYYRYKGLNAAYLEHNYKWGVTMKVPLLLRQGRGEYNKAQIKIKDINLQIAEKSWQLQTKVRQYYNEATQLQNQLQIALTMYRNFNFLRSNEELRFSQGESSLFLVNSRETKALEMQQKLIQIRIKYLKAVYAIDWAMGTVR